MTITACNRAAAVQRGLPAPAAPLDEASARQRSNVATLIETSRDTCSTDELSGGNSHYPSFVRLSVSSHFLISAPLRFPCYLGGNLSDTGGVTENSALSRFDAQKALLANTMIPDRLS